MIVMIVNAKDEKLTLKVIIVPINCGPNDEEHIKRAIESRKNDPNTLLAIMARDVHKAYINFLTSFNKFFYFVQDRFDFRKYGLMPLTEVRDFVKTLKQGSMLHNYCPN